MTNFKKTTTTVLTTALLGSVISFNAANAQSAPTPFAQIDADANGQVNFTEYAKDAELRGQTILTAMRQFNVIANGSDSFDESQYASSFAIKGEIDARDSHKTVVMAVEPTAVLSETATALVVETPEDNSEPVEEPAMNAMDNEASLDQPALDDPEMDNIEVDDIQIYEETNSNATFDPDVTSEEIAIETTIKSDAELTVNDPKTE